MGPMGLFQTVISGLIYFQIQTLSNVNLDKTCPFEIKPTVLRGLIRGRARVTRCRARLTMDQTRLTRSLEESRPPLDLLL